MDLVGLSTDHYDAFEDADGRLHGKPYVEVVLHQVLATVTDVFAHGEVPKTSPFDRMILSRARFSLTDFTAETEEHVIAAAIGYALVAFQQLSEMVQDNLPRAIPGRRTVTAPME
jgi:hypothetical protein